MTPSAASFSPPAFTPPSRDLARWKYGIWAKGHPAVWTFPGRPKPTPRPEGKACLAASNRFQKRTKDGTTYETTKWEERNRKKRATVDGLRRACFVVHRDWERAGEFWASGPCNGMAVVDPQELYNQVNDCCDTGVLRPTTGGVHGNVAVFPRRCKRHKFCAICAASESADRAEHVLVVAGRTGRPGPLVSVVFTHRDRPPLEERNAAAWGRHESAWQRLRTGKNGEWWRSVVYGYQENLETTTGKTGWSWHPHGHILLELREGVNVETFTNELARRWRRCTTLAALEYGYGTDVFVDELGARRKAVREEGARLRALGTPRTGLETLAELREARELALRAVEGDIGWDRAAWWDAEAGRERGCAVVEGTDEEVRSAVREDTKYATPHVEDMDPARLAEWMQWAVGRRLVRWGGEWAREDVQEWIDAQVAYDRAEEHKRLVKAGKRPDLGEQIKGSQKAVTLVKVEERRALGFLKVEFEQLGCQRELEAVDGIRAWWTMAAEHQAAVRAARKLCGGADGDDTRSTEDKAAAAVQAAAAEESYRYLSEVCADIAVRPVPDALARWAVVRAQLAEFGPLGCCTYAF